MVGTPPKMRCVTIEYEHGLTVVYQDEALEQWAQTYVEGIVARAQLQNLTAQANAVASPEEPANDEYPSNIRTLRERIEQKRADSE